MSTNILGQNAQSLRQSGSGGQFGLFGLWRLIGAELAFVSRGVHRGRQVELLFERGVAASDVHRLVFDKTKDEFQTG